MNRSMLVAACLALGWAPWMGAAARSQNAEVVKELDRLITQAATKDQPPPAAPAKVDAAAKEGEKYRVQLYSDQARRFAGAMADPAQLGEGLRLLTNVGPSPVALDFGFPVVRQPSNTLLGATLNPVEEPVRAQLNIPAGQGLVVSTVSDGGPCASVGLKSFDIIVALGDTSIGKPEDLNKALLELGAKTGSLKVLRGGKRVEIPVKPVPLVTLGVPASEPSDYFIGVSIEAIDEVLQKALQLPEGKGVTITEVIADSPAEKAGFKKYDLITQIDGKPVDNADHLRDTVQKAKARALKIALIRAGKAQTITVTPVLRKVDVSKAEEEQKDSFQVRFRTALTNNAVNEQLAATWVNSQANQARAAAYLDHYRVELLESDKLKWLNTLEEIKKDSQARAEKLEREIRALKVAIEALNDKAKSKK